MSTPSLNVTRATWAADAGNWTYTSAVLTTDEHGTQSVYLTAGARPLSTLPAGRYVAVVELADTYDGVIPSVTVNGQEPTGTVSPGWQSTYAVVLRDTDTLGVSGPLLRLSVFPYPESLDSYVAAETFELVSDYVERVPRVNWADNARAAVSDFFGWTVLPNSSAGTLTQGAAMPKPLTTPGGSITTCARVDYDKVTRTNHVPDPRATTAGNYAGSAGSGGVVTETMVTGAADGPTLPNGTKPTTYARYTWTTANTATPINAAYTVTGQGIPVAASDAVSVLVYFRCSSDATSARAFFRPWTNGANGTTIQAANQTLAAGQWHAVTLSAASLAAGTTGINQIGVAISRLMPAGGTLDITAVMLEKTPAAGTYLDGTFANARWTGTANASTSQLLTPSGAGAGITIESSLFSPEFDPALRAGEPVTMSCYVYLSHTTDAVVEARGQTSAGILDLGPIISDPVTVPAATWTRVSVTVPAHADAVTNYSFDVVWGPDLPGGGFACATGALVETSATVGPFGDGSSPGWFWTDGPGSVSYTVTEVARTEDYADRAVQIVAHRETAELGTLSAQLVLNDDDADLGGIATNHPIRLADRVTGEPLWTGRVESVVQTTSYDRRRQRSYRVVSVSATDAVGQLNATPRYGVVSAPTGGFSNLPYYTRAEQLLTSAPDTVESARLLRPPPLVGDAWEGVQVANLVYESTLWNHLLLWFNTGRYFQAGTEFLSQATMFTDRFGVFRYGDRFGRTFQAQECGPRRMSITDIPRAGDPPAPDGFGPRVPALRARVRHDTQSALNTVELANHASKADPDNPGELLADDGNFGPYTDEPGRESYGARKVTLETCLFDPTADGDQVAAGVFHAHAPDPFGRILPRVESVTISVTDVPPAHRPTLALVELEDGLFARIGNASCDDWPIASIDHEITANDWLITYGLREDS
jgi:hypothetical protein